MSRPFKVKLTKRQVIKTPRGYVVFETSISKLGLKQVKAVSKAYGHSTSALAAMGRLYKKELEEIK